ncbi:hypothetical protein QBC43DRAFT_309654 [Cladorrhinum sp. PSN259]|nr:hypothetical protein QBC43DRAFT_309654 [Cladorrhinum sp. PSN259]
MWQAITNMLYGTLPVRPRFITGGNLIDINSDETAPTPNRLPTAPKETTNPEDGPYKPSVVDVLVVKVMLNKALSFPPEIIDVVIDLAEYWPCRTVEVNFGDDSPETVRGRHGPIDDTLEDKFVIRTPPLALQKWGNQEIYRRDVPPKKYGGEWSAEDFQDLTASPTTSVAHPCRRIVFTISSHDQGWGGRWADDDENGPYNESWTWFEAGLERFCREENYEKPTLAVEDIRSIFPEVEWDSEKSEGKYVFPLFPSDDQKIQANITSDHVFTHHRIVWDYKDDVAPEKDSEAATKLEKSGRGKATGNGKFVRELRIGDMVTVWAKARFPAWVNFISSVKVEVYWAI